MKKRMTIWAVLLGFHATAQLPVNSQHPRIFLDQATKSGLLVKRANLDPDWLDLKDEADDYAGRQVLTWSPATTGVWDDDYIFYNYCGSSWDEAAFTLGMAHQLTKGTTTGSFPTAYSTKLLQLADTILAAYANYPPCSNCDNMFLFNTSYAQRHMGNVIGVIYDWCYDELGTTRRTALLNMINDWYTYMRIPYNVYQSHYCPTGNYYFGNVSCAAFLGYATHGDSPYAQEMIDYARQRILGTQSGALAANYESDYWLSQSFLGELPSLATNEWLGNPSYVTAPHADGIHVQGWAYGAGTTERLVDYCFLVKSATGEEIADSLRLFFDKTSEAFVHALTPNRFQLDHANDWGSFRGGLPSYAFPIRLSAVSEGTPMGPVNEYIANTWLLPANLTNSWNDGYPALSWEKLLYKDAARPSAAFSYDPFYPNPADAVQASVPINKGLPKYYMRTNWTANSVWATLNMSNAFYDDHDHNNAGHFTIIRGDSHDGDDQLLVGANEIGGEEFGMNGIEGATCYHGSSSLSNTLFFDDYGDYSDENDAISRGGQSSYGYDEPTHQEQTNVFSYVRADLTSAYFANGQVPDTSSRTLSYFYRSFVYLRNADIFVTYDKLQAKTSTNPSGPYEKHLRWHFMEDPVINGNNVTATMDNSKLFVHTVIPATVNVTKSNESSNTDNSFGADWDYAFDTPTWRAEVRVPANPLKQDIVTVLQPGGIADQEMITTAVTTTGNTMEGSLVRAGGMDNIVLFNTNTDKYLTPVNSTSYAYTWTPGNWHTLCGMVPDGLYQVDYDQTTVTVALSATGNVTASPSGVLSFYASSPLGLEEQAAWISWEAFPNPSEGSVTVTWESPQDPIETVVVSTITGEAVGTYAVSQLQTLNIGLEKPGMYYVILYSQQHAVHTKKILIIR